MTRGTLYYYEDDDNVWSSTEFNGDMYHGTTEKPQGNGDKVIKLMTGLKSLDDFRNLLKEINKDYDYDEGNDCWSVNDEAIAIENKRAIEWIDNERPDLKGNDNFDPRAMERIPTFKDVRTWQFWGTPNLSDYSYIYNNSGEDLVMITRDNGEEMIIPDGCCGVLNYGGKDCLCRDGKIIDGMGHYKTSPELKEMNKKQFFEYITGNFTLDATSRNLVLNILDYVESKVYGEDEIQDALLELLDGIGLEDEEIKHVKL